MGIFFFSGGGGRVFDPDARPSWKGGMEEEEMAGGYTHGVVECAWLFPPPLNPPTPKPPYTRRGRGSVSTAPLTLFFFLLSYAV
jgi:hypothetical protein